MSYVWVALLLLIVCPVVMWMAMRGGHGDSYSGEDKRKH